MTFHNIFLPYPFLFAAYFLFWLSMGNSGNDPDRCDFKYGVEYFIKIEVFKRILVGTLKF